MLLKVIWFQLVNLVLIDQLFLLNLILFQTLAFQSKFLSFSLFLFDEFVDFPTQFLNKFLVELVNLRYLIIFNP